MVKLVANKYSTYLPMTQPITMIDIVLHLACTHCIYRCILLKRNKNEKSDILTTETQQSIIISYTIMVIAAIAYRKMMHKNKSYVTQPKGKGNVRKAMTSYDSISKSITTYNLTDIHIKSVVAMKSTTHTERVAQFDTDSGPLGIDNRCSACISHIKADFIGELIPCTRTIKGFRGTRPSVWHTHWYPTMELG